MKQVIVLNADGSPHIRADDPWLLIENDIQLADAPANQPVILPLNLWEARQSARVLAGETVSDDAIWLTPDDEVETILAWLPVLPLIAVHFPSFRDGRGYSQAYLLHNRYGWRGELRAVGDVLRDQLSHMRQCGFNAFAIRADKSVDDALKGLQGLSVLYGRSAIQPEPLFRRRS